MEQLAAMGMGEGLAQAVGQIDAIHALVDGDVLYAVSTNEVDNPALDSVGLGVIASELAWDAVLAAVSA
jgi:6-aminohexanoate-oligomer endohydrolase